MISGNRRIDKQLVMKVESFVKMKDGSSVMVKGFIDRMFKKKKWKPKLIIADDIIICGKLYEHLMSENEATYFAAIVIHNINIVKCAKKLLSMERKSPGLTSTRTSHS